MSKNLYKNLIYDFNKNTLRVYTNMLSNSQKSTKCYTERANLSSKEIRKQREERKNLTYVKFLEMREKTGMPAKMSERRFKWQVRGDGSVNYPVDPEIFPGYKKRSSNPKEELEGGFSNFFNSNNKNNANGKHKKKINPYLKNRRNNLKETNRVINPYDNVRLNLYIIFSMKKKKLLEKKEIQKKF